MYLASRTLSARTPYFAWRRAPETSSRGKTTAVAKQGGVDLWDRGPNPSVQPDPQTSPYEFRLGGVRVGGETHHRWENPLGNNLSLKHRGRFTFRA